MKHQKMFLVLLTLLVVGVWAIVLQNTGLIPPLSRPEVDVANTVRIRGSVDVDNTVTLDTYRSIDVNLAEVAGYDLVSSERGMYIGVSSSDNKIIPVHWGEITISR